MNWPPARPSQLEDHLTRHARILTNAGARFLITVPEARQVGQLLKRQTGALEASLKSYKKALRLDRKHLGANEYIGELYLQMDRPKKARKYLKRLARYCDDCEEYRDLKAAVEAYESGG